MAFVWGLCWGALFGAGNCVGALGALCLGFKLVGVLVIMTLEGHGKVI